MKETSYIQEVVQAAVAKLQKTSKISLTEKEMVSGIVKRLKKKLGKDHQSHSSKSRFHREIFKIILDSKEWKKEITHICNSKFILKKNEAVYIELNSNTIFEVDKLKSKILVFNDLLEIEQNKKEIKYLKNKIEEFHILLPIYEGQLD